MKTPVIYTLFGTLLFTFSSLPALAQTAATANLPVPAAPIISVPGGIYPELQNVVISSSDSNTVIHYTTNGATPTESDPVVASNATVTVSQTLTLKARAFKGKMGGTVTSGTYYLFTDPKTLWVDAKAAADGTGTFLAPYNTIKAAVTASSTSSIIVVRSGTYKEIVNIRKSGTPTAPFTLQGAPGERVIVSGMQTISDWTPYQGRIYVAEVGTWDWPPDAFHVGMNQRHMAQSPNVGDHWWAWEAKALDSSNNTVITDTAHLVGIGDLAGGFFQSYETDINGITGRRILSNDPVAGTVTIDGNYPTLAANNTYIIQNRPQLLDQPGEWICVATGSDYQVYYWPNDASELSRTQARKAKNNIILLYGVHDVLVQGLEIMGASAKGTGIAITNGTNVNIRWNVIHDNGGYFWKGIRGLPWGTGVQLDKCTNCTISNNYITLNRNGVTISSSTNCTVTQNDIGYNDADGIDIDGRAGAYPCVGLTISNNYIHHHYNLTLHADGLQGYDAGVRDVHVLDNLFLAVPQLMHNGFSGQYRGNVIWNASFNSLGRTGTGGIVLANNTVRPGLAVYNGMPTSSTENVINGRYSLYDGSYYTGDRNLIFPIAPDTYAYQSYSKWKVFTSEAAYYAYSGREQNSLVADPLVANMPTTKRSTPLGDVTKCTANTLVLFDSLNRDALADFRKGDHIEINMDGVLRTITAVNAADKSITFDNPLAGYAPYARETFVENWGSRTNFTRDSRLLPNSPGQTMSATGGPVGSLINISEYQAGDFNGDGVRDIPVLPTDVPHSVDFYTNSRLTYATGGAGQ